MIYLSVPQSARMSIKVNIDANVEPERLLDETVRAMDALSDGAVHLPLSVDCSGGQLDMRFVRVPRACNQRIAASAALRRCFTMDSVTLVVCICDTISLSRVPPNDVAYLDEHGDPVVSALRLTKLQQHSILSEKNIIEQP